MNNTFENIQADLSNLKRKLSTVARAGFTLIELVITMAIFATLAGISTITLFNAQHKTTVNAAVDVFVAEVKAAQLRAMVGDSGGGTGAADYGVHLESESYTLFRDTYGTANVLFELPQGLEFTTPGTEILFSKGSGEVAGGPASVVIRDKADNNQKTIQVNKYGIVTGVN